jgi:hypothetical protein
MNSKLNVEWMAEPIEKVPGNQGRYRLMCLLLFKRRMTYANMYVLTYALHKHKFKDNEIVLKEKIMKDLASIYYFNNKRLPDGFKFVMTNETE